MKGKYAPVRLIRLKFHGFRRPIRRRPAPHPLHPPHSRPPDAAIFFVNNHCPSYIMSSYYSLFDDHFWLN